MKIAYILPSLARKGPIIVVNDIINNLYQKIDEIVVFYFDDVVEMNFPCRVQRIRFNEKVNFDYFDIIHSHMLRPDLYLCKNKLLGNIKRAKIVTTLHQYNYFNLKYEYKKLLSFLVAKIWNFILFPFDKIVVLSNNMKIFYEKQIFPSKKIVVIPNGRPLPNNINLQNIPQLFETTKCAKSPIFIGTSCYITKRKGLEQVINVLPLIDNLYFIIIGDGPEKNNLLKLAEELGVKNRCIFLGFKDNPLEYINNFDLFILPSRSEGFSLSAIEAASMRKAIILSNLNLYKGLFSHDEVVFFELDNINDLKNKIVFAYENKFRLGENIYKKYLLNYTDKIMANSYYKMYEELVIKYDKSNNYH